MNVIMLNITQRYDLMNESVVNKKVQKANEHTGKVCKIYKYKPSGLSGINRSYHIRHDVHLNQVGN
jgi:hypothetical protein